MMKKYFAAAGAICLLTAMPAAAQETAAHNRATELTKGDAVVIEGCVAAGEKDGTYVLGTVREVPGIDVQTGRKRIYWLDTTKHIKGHVGRQVRIAGRVTDLERSEIEVDLGAGANGGAIAKIEGPGMSDVKVPAGVVAVGTSGADVPITLVKIKVDKVTRLKTTCS